MASTKNSALAVNATVDLTAMNTEIFINYRSFEQQAPSSKLQAASIKHQAIRASSSKRQAPSSELQAASRERRALKYLCPHKVSSL
jgi:TfoX/Sxy family transcriptional regulator of competence genes